MKRSGILCRATLSDPEPAQVYRLTPLGQSVEFVLVGCIPHDGAAHNAGSSGGCRAIPHARFDRCDLPTHAAGHSAFQKTVPVSGKDDHTK